MTSSSLVSTAASAAAVIPFHCVICFDEFNLKMRYPVVLPCGHTYVCNPCARRLKRCMECREPLFINAAPKNVNHANNNARGGGPPLHPHPHGRYQAPASPVPAGAAALQHQAEPIALPLPKNLVLVSMMEAAESQARVTEEENDSISRELGVNINDDKVGTRSKADDDNDDDDEDEYDSNKIISAMVTFSGPCGTYVVKELNGLAVLPSHPEKGCQPVETEREHRLLNSEARIEPFTIFQGQTVQVVSFSHGVAKLARGAGFIVATSSQLVKVGAPLDRCCRLEGMVDTMSLRGNDLQAALSENQQLESHLKIQVEKEQQHEPTHPVISEVPAESDEKEHLKSQNETTKRASSKVLGYEDPLLIPGSPREVFITEATDSSGLELVGENRGLLYSDGTTRKPASPNSIDNSAFDRIEVNAPGMPRYRRNSDDDLNEFAFGCGSSLFGKTFLNFEYESEHGVGLSFDSLEDVHQPSSHHTRQHENAVSGDHGSVSSPARPLQSQTHVTNFMSAASPMFSSSFDTVDWRTGMSGHRALSKTSPRSNFVARNVRMMSEHRGIGAARAASRNSNSPSTSPALAPPQFISPNECDEHM